MNVEPPLDKLAGMGALLSDGQLLERLVGFDSVSSNSNLPIAEFIADYLDGAPETEVAFNRDEEAGKANLFVQVGGRGSGEGEGLILSGHMDVVPAREPEWESDPFEMRETEEAYYGRGTADMKGFVALAVNQAREWAERRPQKPLALILTYDEEVGLLGAQHFARSWEEPSRLPRNAVIGEPTELEVVRLHKGQVQVRTTLRGVSAHSAYPHLGRSAIEPAAEVVLALKDLRLQLAEERHETSKYYPETPYVSINVGQIRGGEAVNVIPDRCVLEISVRTMPGMGSREIVGRIRDTVEGLGLPDCEFEYVNEAASLMAPAESEVHQRLCSLVGQRKTGAVSYASDAGVFQRMGIDCVLYGPGSIEVAHKPNERMPKDQFAEARGVLEKLAGSFCAAS